MTQFYVHLVNMIHIIWVQWFKILVESWNYTDSYIFKAIFFRVNYAEIWHLLASEQNPLGTKQQRVGISAFASSYQRLEGFLFDFLRVEIARLLWHIHECGHYLIMTFLRPFLRTEKIEYLCESSTPGRSMILQLEETHGIRGEVSVLYNPRKAREGSAYES